LRAQIFTQHGDKVGRRNAFPAQFGPISFLGQKRLAAEDAGPSHHAFVKRQVLKRVQRVVMNEDSDRSLCRQQVSRVLDRLAQLGQIGLAIVAGLRRCAAWSGGLHGKC